MALKYKENIITTMEEIQALTAKDLKSILRENGVAQGGIKADIVLKVYAIMVRGEPAAVSRPSSERVRNFTYETALSEISPSNWSGDLRCLPELSFIQLYDYLVVYTRKYKHIVLKGTNFKKLKSYQFFYEGHTKGLEIKTYNDLTYVRASVLASMKKKRYKVVVEFSSGCDVTRAACTCPAGLGKDGKGKCNHIGGVLFAMEDFARKGLQHHPEPLSCTSQLSVWVVPRNQSVAARPYDKILIRKIRFGQRNIRASPKIINFDPRAPHDRALDKTAFNGLCEGLQNCLPASSFFLFHDVRSNCEVAMETEPEQQSEESMPFNDNYDIAKEAFKSMIDIHVENMTITEDEINLIESRTRGQGKNEYWHEKMSSILTGSNFGKAAKNRVEPSNKIKSMLYSNFQTEAVLYGTESEPKAVKLYLTGDEQKGLKLEEKEVGLLVSKETPYLGASLDRVIFNPATGEGWALEVKAPLSKAGMTVEESCKVKNFFLEKKADGMFGLKANHDYFYQIQGQIYVSGMKYAVLIVFYGDDQPLFEQRIDFNAEIWHRNMLPRLDFFYRRALLPELLTRRVKRAKLLYLKGGWVPYGQFTCTETSPLKLHLKREC